jgi:ribosome maturation factor RimP
VTADDLLATIRDRVAGLGFELADLKQSGTRERPILQVRIDHPGGTGGGAPGQGVTAEECARVSRALEAHLESAGAVGPRYVLEVSSPGIERPLRWIEHWRRFVGSRARVKSSELRGRTVVDIVAVPDDEHVSVRLPDGSERTLALAEIKDATLAVDWGAIVKGRRPS